MEWLLALMAASVLATVEAARRGAAWGGLTKMTASTCFLILAWRWGALDSQYGALIFGGLCLSWVGDGLLISKRSKFFLAGLAAFLGAHIVYTVAFWQRPLDSVWLLAAGAAALIAYGIVHRWLMPHAGKMKLAVIAYMVAILVMVASAIAVLAPLVVAGAALFAASDLFVARQRFIAPTWLNRAIGLPLYYAAQVLLVLSV